MKKKVFSLMMTLLLAFMGVAKADVVTIGDGTGTTYYAPYNSLWGYSFVEQVYLASEIGTAGTINSISFNMSSTDSQTNQVDVFMKNVSRTNFSSGTDWETVTASDMVFSGTVTFNNGWTTITLDTPFEYDGTSNLMIGMHEKTSGYSTRYFYYTSVTGGLISGHSDSADPNPYDMGSYSGTTYTQNYRANIQIDITPGGGAGAGEQIFAVQDGNTVDTVYVGARPNGCWMEPFKFQIRNTGANTTINHLDWTPNTYFELVEPELPVNIARDEDIDVLLNTGESTNTEWQMVALYGTGRTAAIWTMVVEPYDPAIPDVVEMAYDLGTVGNGFTYTGVPSQITPTVLHDDYTLPFPEIEDGYDAVYKFTVATDMILNAYVDTLAENGKVALYTEDFYGEGGPMADNNYTGLNLNGGSGGSGGGGAAFQAQIGEGTTTSTYFPFHSLWNYSLAENLFLASELTEAGVTTAPMTSLSWYVSSTSCTTPQNNISIWMANVSDAALTTTSHTTDGMTLVYTGNSVLPTAGEWNEFVFNAGNFAWDGHSNILILCTRNNGSYQGSISWQTHNPGFLAMTYSYSDTNGGYYVATAPQTGMYTSTTNRANIIFKGGNRDRSRDLVDFESGNLPAGWDASQGYNDWYVDEEDYWGHAPAYAGSYSLYVDGNGEYGNDYFVSPATEFAGAGSLSFAYATPSWSGDQNDLSVGYSTSQTGPWTIFPAANELQSENWQTVNLDLSSLNGTYYIAFISYDGYGYCTAIDNINIDVPTTPTPGPTPTPGAGLAVSAGPVIENLGLTPGTYYLVASATQADYDVFINVENMPCPAVDAEDYAFNPTPADDADEVEPGSVTLRWTNPQFATEWRLVFGSTYYPEPNHDQTIITDWSSTMATSYTVTNLWNNTNYFWHIEYRNDACMDGVSSPIVGFTTHLNIPTNLTAEDYTIFNDEQVVLHWNAVVDRTYRMYFIYRDGVKVGETQVNNIGATTFTDGPLAYNMTGYVYYVTAIYDEGESAPSDPVTVKVSGYGDVNGHVYEQDGTTGIAGATVTMVGTDEFNDPHTYNLTTNSEGYYTGHIYAGSYDGMAAKDGYQTIYEPIQGNPINITYNQTTSPVDYILDENFDPVCAVIAEYYPDSLDPNSPYVKVYWGCGLPGSEIIEPFETGDFSLFDWQVDPTYPWSITTTNPYEGTYCMKSGGAGVANVVSNMTVTVNIPADGLMSFFGKISCESSWDYGYFYIDGVQKGSYTGAGNWAEKVFDITAGDHTFQWRYTKDGSVNSNDDCFYVDYITFYKQPAPPVPGMTYDFEDHTMQGWTSVDADGDGYGWRVGSELMSGVAGHNSSEDFVFSQSYDNSYGVLYPDNYLVSPQVQLGGIVRFYACAQDAGYAAEHFGVAVSTTNTNPSSFTMVQEWTMSAKSVAAPAGKPIKGQRSGREQGNWYEYTVDLSAYSGNGYVAIRHFNCSDMFYLDVDDITIGEPGKGIAESRSLDHYRVYRTNCYNDGPYEEPTTVLLATVWVPDTVYIDVEWADLAPGVYKWGVGAVYSGNRGEMTEGEINWSEPVSINPDMANRDEMYDFENGQIPSGWTNSTNYPWTVDSNTPTGSYCIKSSNGGVASTTSSIQTTADFAEAGTVSFDANCQGEGTSTFWDHCDFAIDGNVMLTAGANISGWNHYSFPVTAGTHTFMWSYTKDSSVNPTGDAFFVDNVAFSGNGGGGGGGGGQGGGAAAGGEPIQLERESVIVWSNCLDKDMYLNDVTVTVLLNSADSPAGTTVTFTNTNEYEQQTYGGYNLTLDESGYYAFDSFRRGEYNISVRHEGYEPIDETHLIWDNEDLRYVMIEILYGVENVYVSRTGWAMWDDSHNNPGGGGGGQGGGTGATSFTDDFEGGLNNWTAVDADGDGHNWYHSSQSMTYACYDYTGWGHNSSNGFAVSSSYTDCTYDSYDPNNFLITNQKYSIVAGSTLNFWADYGNDSYPDHFGVAVATADNPTPADFTIVWEGNAKDANNGKSQLRHDGDRYMNWRSHSVDLSAYAGQDVYIAFRHFNSYDEYEIYIDDVELTAGRSDERHLEYYKVMCTSIDGVPIYNHNTPWPFCQLSTNEPYNAPLVEGEHYLCKVAAVYSTGMSEWSTPVEWEYEPCDHWGPVDEVSVNTLSQGNHIEWVFEHGFNPYDPGTGGGGQGGVGDTFSFDCDGGMPTGWTTLDMDGDGLTWVSSNNPGVYHNSGVNLSGTGHNASEAYVISGSYANQTGQVLYPDNYLVSPLVNLVAGSTFSFWACAQDASYAAEHFGVSVSSNGTDWTLVDEWTLTAKSAGAVSYGRNGNNRAQGNWYQKTVDLSSYAGQKYIAIRHFNCYDQFILNVDDIELTNGAKNGGYNAMESGMLANGTYAFNITDIANYDERVYFLYNLVNDSRFDVINGEAAGMFIISATSANLDLEEAVNDFIYSNNIAFGQMDKVQAADVANAYKSSLPAGFVNSLMMDMYIQSRENNMCEFADPFCTDNGMYEFPAGVNAGSGEAGPDYDCLYTQPNPAWYYMRIGAPGEMDIHMYSTPEVDIDFCCWGPFDDPTTPCPYGLTEDKVVSCSYSTSWTEHCMIPATAQTGEYYILVITNYSNQACNINFSMVAGAGSTDCGILPPVDIIGFLITQDGEYLAFAGPTDREYTDLGEFGDHEYCVRPIYPGEMVLPSNNFGWSMGCPVCASTSGTITCEMPYDINIEQQSEASLKVWWGEEPAAPVSEWLYYDDGTYATSVGAGGTLYWGTMFPAASLAPYAGTSLTKVAIFTSYACSATLNVYVGGAQPGGSPAATQTFTMAGDQEFMEINLNNPVPVDGTQNLWITFYQSGETYPADACNDTGDANNRWVSIDGAQWMDLATAGLPGYGWMIRGFVTNQAKGGVIASLPEFKGNVGGELSHTEVVSKPADLSFMNRATLVKYNVYRSTEAAGDYALIGSVNEDGSGYYEYIDTPVEAGTYYYQVRAEYSDECESDPAMAADGSGNDYVSGTTTGDGMDELDGNVSLYPNPTKDNVTIEANGMSRITVVSVLGQVVFDKVIGADTYTLNMSQFNAGMYMVRVYTENGVTVKRVTVMR